MGKKLYVGNLPETGIHLGTPLTRELDDDEVISSRFKI